MRYVIKLFLIACLFPLTCLSQAKDNCNSRVEAIYDAIIESVGNKTPVKPRLKITDSKSRVAYISRGEISIEQKTIDLFCQEENFQSKIAYILSHEIAHHYLRHDWMKNSGLLYNSEIKDFVRNNNDSIQRKIAETEADAFAGFFSLKAGYKSLNYAEEVLTRLYKEYKIPKVIPGYPSLSERIEIINSNIKKADNLSRIFEVGNLALACGKLSVATNAFEDILNDDFNSREIYNNLGVAYLLTAIENLSEELSKFSYPVFIDQVTRADLSKTRSSGFINPLDHLEKAEENFSLAIEIDKGYGDPKFNILISKLISGKVNGVLSKEFISKIETLDLDENRKNDLKILYYLFNDKKKKASKILDNASIISRFNYDQSIEVEIPNSDKLDMPVYEAIDLNTIRFRGLNKKESKKYKTSRSRNSIWINKTDDYKLIEINKEQYFAEISNTDFLKQIDLFFRDKKPAADKKIAISNFLYEIYFSGNLVLKKSLNNKIVSVIYPFK